MDSFLKKGAKTTPSGWRLIIFSASVKKLPEFDWLNVKCSIWIPNGRSSFTRFLTPTKGLFQYPSEDGGSGNNTAKTADFFDASVLAKKLGW